MAILSMCSIDNPQVILEIPQDLVLVAYRGSVAHGMYVPKSDPNSIDDIDLIGFAIGGPQHYFGLKEWGSRGTREVVSGHYDCVWYEFRKAVSLLLQGNPNILSALWLRQSEYIRLEQEGSALLENRHLFVGKHVYNSFAGYAHAQLLKMELREPADVREYLGVTYALKHRSAHPTDQLLPQDLGDHTDCSEWSTEKLLTRYRHFIRKGENIGYLGDKRKRLLLAHGYDAKNGAHCIRLLKMCKEFLTTGTMKVFRADDAGELLAIKRGDWHMIPITRLRYFGTRQPH